MTSRSLSISRKRRGPDLGERLHRVAMHFGDARHGVARREHAAEPGRDQQVARFNVGVRGQIGQRQRSRVARSHGDGPQSRALDLHGHRVLRVGDQNDFRAPRTDVRGLAEQAIVVQHRLCLEDPVAGAAVDAARAGAGC